MPWNRPAQGDHKTEHADDEPENFHEHGGQIEVMA
jgi:hypothetical protein